MKKLKQRQKAFFGFFQYFYRRLKRKVFYPLTASIFVGLLDGFGLAMFMPLLQVVDADGVMSSDNSAGIEFIVEGIEHLGLTLNLETVLGVMLFFMTLKGVARFFEGYVKLSVEQVFIRSLRLDSISKLSNFKYKSFVQADTGQIQNTLSGEMQRVLIAYRAYFNTLQSGVMLSVYGVLALSVNSQFALMVSIGGFLSNLVFQYVYKKTKHLSRKITKDANQFQGLLLQMVSYFKYLKATGLLNPFSKKLKDSAIEIENSNRKIGILSAIILAVREPLVVFVVVVVIIVQVNLFGQSLGTILLSLLFFYRALTYVLNLQTEWNKFLNMSGSLENMTDFHQDLDKAQDSCGEKVMEYFHNDIALEQVNFSYGQKSVLRDINLTIKKNETVAFVGESGAGKSTVVNLMTGLMPISSGSIKIDGVELSEYELSSFQNKIGYITQDPVVFNGTIYENVTLWGERNEENDHRFEYALKQAAIFDFVQTLSEKENELLGNNGINLSGGQKQRISIARELYKQVDLLIMDEATSALDSETEQIIQENIDQLKGKYTILIIAHRLSTVKSADRVILMKNGRLMADGTFEKLLESSSEFERMVSFQTL